MKKTITLSFLLAFVLLASQAFATNWYVSAQFGSNSNAGTSDAQPFATIKKAHDVTNPGDTVFIMNGTYNPISNFQQSIVTITRSGTPGAYITYKAYPGHTPKLQLLTGLSFQIWRAIAVDASYIMISGLEIEGTNQLLNYTDAYQTWQDYENNIKDFNKISMYNCGSISIGGGAAAHHVIITNCNIHDTGGGIGGFNCDYVTIDNNQVYNTCWYSMYAGSGISILDPRSIDNITSYKMFIRNNVVHNNKTLIPWEKTNALSDGNGIILDVNVGNGSTVPAYVGRYLVANNLSYNNGGGGVHGYKAAHVDIINNTAYNNGTVVGYPEIDANQCSDVKIYNNIMFARTGGNCNGNDANTTYDYNQYFNGPSFKNGPNDKTGNPLFVAPGITGTANFQLQATSPAVNNGSNVAGQFIPTDILNVARPVGFASDKGAYEYPTVIARAEMKISQGAAEIVDNTGTYDFGDVSSTAPKTVTFTIDNLGDLGLSLTGSPRVVVANTTGTGFSLGTDAPVSVAAGGSVTFQVVLSPSSTAGNYAGTISIANSDADENPYNFAITGYGYDGNKAQQTITFPALPIKTVGSADFDPGATSSAGLAITYTSSNLNVATIVAGKIRVTAAANNAGTTIITASQPGDATTNPARNVTQVLTVTPVLPSPGGNMISNPTFDANTTGWTFANKGTNPAPAAAISSSPLAGSPTNVGQVVITSLPTPAASDNIQIGTRIFIVKDRNYLISFRAHADAPRAVGLRMFLSSSPFSTAYSRTVNITTTPTNYGTYAFTSGFTAYVDFRFLLGTANTTTYFDDVIITEEPNATPAPVTLVSFSGSLVGNNAVLAWKTAFESNSKEYVAEKSLDGNRFSEIGSVASRNSSTGGSYSFTDRETIIGKVFYRLKSVDRDGSFKYSNVVTLVGAKPGALVKLFPNPAISYSSVTYPVASANAMLSIYASDGRKVADYRVATGSTQQSIDVSEIGKGVYFILYRNNGQVISSPFIK